MAGVMTDEYQTYYSILFMPSFVISLMCEFVFKPTITTIAELWWENNVKKFTLYILRIIGIILVCCVAVVAGGHLIGRTLLEIIYGVDLSPYKLHFVVLLIGGGISAEVYMIYNILIAIRWGGKGGGEHTIHEWYEPAESWKGPQRDLLLLLALSGYENIREYQLPRINPKGK